MEAGRRRAMASARGRRRFPAAAFAHHSHGLGGVRPDISPALRHVDPYAPGRRSRHWCRRPDLARLPVARSRVRPIYETRARAEGRRANAQGRAAPRWEGILNMAKRANAYVPPD